MSNTTGGTTRNKPKPKPKPVEARLPAAVAVKAITGTATGASHEPISEAHSEAISEANSEAISDVAWVADEQTREAMIRLAAYTFYERRGYVSGAELEDWLEAEMEVDRQLTAVQPTGHAPEWAPEHAHTVTPVQTRARTPARAPAKPPKAHKAGAS